MAMNSHLLSKLREEKRQLKDRLETLQAKASKSGKFSNSEEREWESLLAQGRDIDRRAEDELNRITKEEAMEPLPDGPFMERKSVPKSPDLFGSLGEFMQAVATAKMNPAETDHRLLELNAWGRKVQASISGVGTLPTEGGGFMLQTNFQMEILRSAIAESVLWKRCRTFPLQAYERGVKLPVARDKNRATGSRLGGVTLTWTPEGGEITDSNVRMDQLEITPSKLAGLAYVTNELLNNVPLMSSIYETAFAEELRFVVDDAIYRGNSGACGMLGLLNAGCLVSQAAETGQAANTIVPQNVVKMFSRLPARSIRKAVFYYNQDCTAQLHLMTLPVGTAGQLLMLPGGDLTEAPFGRLMGIPLEPIEYAETLGTVGDILLADLSQYGIVEQGPMRLDWSHHVKFTSDQGTFRLIHSLGGQSLWSDAITPYKGSNTQSPIVALATRS